jgi:hypothetical protein
MDSSYRAAIQPALRLPSLPAPGERRGSGASRIGLASSAESPIHLFFLTEWQWLEALEYAEAAEDRTERVGFLHDFPLRGVCKNRDAPKK